MQCTRYSFNPSEGLAVFEPGCRLSLTGRSQIAYREATLFANQNEVIDFLSAGQSYLTLTVMLRQFESPLVWLFDRSTLSSTRSISGSDSASRAELLLQLFEELKYPDARQVLQLLLESPHHFLRWRAVQALLRLHGTAGIDAVRKMRNDSHPHVRRAAERTLKNLEILNLA